MRLDRKPAPALGLIMLAALGTILGCATAPIVPRRCPVGLQGSFLQLTDSQLRFGVPEWSDLLRILRASGADTVILQFSGDVAGAYEDRDEARGRPLGPVRAVLAAAQAEGMQVYIGLHADPSWPSDGATARLPPPLDDPGGSHELASLCRQSPACAGWYLPNEIDDETWASPARTRALRDYLVRTGAALRALSPGHPVVVAPFYSGRRDPQAHARWWGELMIGRPFDILALQDGVGTGRVTPERAAEYLRALGPVAARAGVRLWSVVELFHQLHGAPHDNQPFAAEPASFSTVQRSLDLERPLVERAIGFAVLDYMNPQGSWRARRLYNNYVEWCERALPAVISPQQRHGAVSMAKTTTKKGT